MKIIRSKALNFREAIAYNFEKTENSLEDLSVSQPEKFEDLVQSSGHYQIAMESKQAERIGGNIPQFDSSRKALKFFNQIASQNTRAKHQCLHAKISFDPEDQIDQRSLQKIGDKVMGELGYVDCPYVTFQHFDEPHPHIHIVASRIDKNGRTVSDSFDGLKCKVLERELEAQYGLVSSQDKKLRSGVRMASYWESDYEDRKQIRSVKNVIRCTVEKALEDNPHPELFLNRLHRDGIELKTRSYISSHGDVKYGLSYGLKERANYRFSEPIIDDKKYTSLEDSLDYSTMVSPDVNNILHFDGKYPYPDLEELNKEIQRKRNNSKYKNKELDLAVRASRIGPSFSMNGISKSLGIVEDDLIKSIESFKPFSHSSSDMKLFAAIDYRSEIGVTESLNEGADLEAVSELFISNDKLELLSNVSSKISQEQNASFNIIVNNDIINNPTSLHEAFNNYERIYGEPNELTKQLLEYAEDGELHSREMRSLLERLNDDRLQLTLRPDPRIIPDQWLSNLPDEIRIKCLQGRDELNNKVLIEPALAPVKDRPYYEFNKSILKSLDEKDYTSLEQLIKSDRKMVDPVVITQLKSSSSFDEEKRKDIIKTISTTLKLDTLE